ncbi:MAG: pectate lyase [Pirellulaceae bacterium]
MLPIQSFRTLSILGCVGLLAVACLTCRDAKAADELTKQQAVEAMHRAVRFFNDKVSVQGGYVFQYSSDLSLREGEAKVGPDTAWIEPPATPSVGMAYLNAYQLTGDSLLLTAARRTASALMRGQLLSGGWGEQIEFAEAQRRQFAYRVDGKPNAKAKNVSTLDDNKSQSALSFLIALDAVLEFEDAALREAIDYGLASLLDAQYPNGAWPQRYQGKPDADQFPVLKASYPEDWPRTFPKEKYDSYYTLNDETQCDTIATMLQAADIYKSKRYFDSAVRGAEFLLLAQMPAPQPGWAQQYDRSMHPAWARKFEPPAITGGESQSVMRTLLLMYRRTGNVEFVEAVERALPYYRRSLLPDGRLPRFLELRTNRPLYLTRQYELTYEANDLPTHYAFIVGQSLDAIERELKRVRELPSEKLWEPKKTKAPKYSDKLMREAAERIKDLDRRGAWVEQGELRKYDHTPGNSIISSKTFIRNLLVLAEFIAADK